MLVIDRRQLVAPLRLECVVWHQQFVCPAADRAGERSEGCRTDRTGIPDGIPPFPVQIALNCGTYRFVALGGVTGLGATVSHAIPSVSHDNYRRHARWTAGMVIDGLQTAWGRLVDLADSTDDFFSPCILE